MGNDLTEKEKETRDKYHMHGKSKFDRCPKNVIFLYGESILHELSKSLLGIGLRKYGENVLSKKVIFKLKDIEYLVKEQGFMANPVNFISEAIPNEDSKRRVDVVELSTNIRFEIETNHKEDKSVKDRLVKTIYV